MFGAETKALFAKYFQKNISQFSWYTVQLVYTSMSDKLFILVFVTSYQISWHLLMDIFCYPLIGQFDTV